MLTGEHELPVSQLKLLLRVSGLLELGPYIYDHMHGPYIYDHMHGDMNAKEPEQVQVLAII